MSTVLFISETLIIVAALILAAYLSEKYIIGRRGDKIAVMTPKKVAMTGVFAAVSGVFMLIEVPLPFAPPFYKMDISEVPVLVLTFAYGPVSGILCELIKIFVKLSLKGTSSAFVGELANFVIGASLILPAGLLYTGKKTKKRALTALLLGTAVMTLFGSFFNAFYLLPQFAKIYGIPLSAIVDMGAAINPAIDSVSRLVLFCVVPMNLLKGIVDTVITMLFYKRLSPVIK